MHRSNQQRNPVVHNLPPPPPFFIESSETFYALLVQLTKLDHRNAENMWRPTRQHKHEDMTHFIVKDLNPEYQQLLSKYDINNDGKLHMVSVQR